ncbi:MAG: DotA/TraY family protein [Pseudomonadota bacterium]
MSDSSGRDKPSSIMAFMLLPQFGLGFRKYNFIVPVFIRTIAVMFEQAGLLPPNHPAIRYGAEGVRGYGFFDLIGEAWYNLRSTRATPQQWSLFAAVVLMIAYVALSVITALFKASGMLVSTASAQIFDSVLGLTDQASVAAAGYNAAGQMFDKSVPALGTAHGDYGIMILDKMLREGIAGVGGPTQNALGALMQIYNTGVLVIAGIMLFWAVLSVVVDTAKTGQLGGGRHNMVWAPIRIVFGLGLLIPLGASGFSSGQFMVMKLAEWGSNWGTRAWVQYVTAVVNQNLIAAYGGTNPSSLVGQYTRMWICGVAYDSYLTQAQGAAVANEQKVYPILATGLPDFGSQSVSFTNATAGNLCGTITYPTVNDPVLILSGVGPPISDLMTQAISVYKRAMRIAYADLFIDMTAAGATVPFGCGGPSCVQLGSLGATAHDFACGFVNNIIDNPNVAFGGVPMGCAYMAYCGSGTPGTPTYGQFPNTNCIANMVASANASILAAQTAARAPLDAFIAGPGFITDVQNRGWAGMGIWYHRIETMNSAVSSMQDAKISMTAGDPGNAGTAHHAKTVNDVLIIYDAWWLNLPQVMASAAGAQPAALALQTSAGPGNNIETNSAMGSSKSLVFGLKDLNPMGIVNIFTGILGDHLGTFIFNLVDPADVNTYPLAKLAKVGDGLGNAAMLIYGLMTLLEILASGIACGKAVGYTVGLAFGVCDAANTLSTSFIPPMILTMASMMSVASIMLKYYIPLLPFISVAHAVLTWMISVFEATMMVPLAALSHLTTEGDGIAGHSRQVWILWLNVLMRPILTVIGFVAAMLIFNTFVVYLHEVFVATIMNGFTSTGGVGFFQKIMSTIIYVFIIYTAATTTFKLLDLLPDAMMRWMGGAPDKSFDHGMEGALVFAGDASRSLSSGYGRQKPLEKPTSKKPAIGGGGGGSNPISPGGTTRWNAS